MIILLFTKCSKSKLSSALHASFILPPVEDGRIQKSCIEFSVQHRPLEALGNTFPTFLANVNYLHNHLERQHPQALLL